VRTTKHLPKRKPIEPIKPFELAIEDMTTAEKAGLVNVEYILAKFVEAVEGIGVFKGIKPTQVIRALERLGDFKKMFVQMKKVDIDFKGLLASAPISHLERIVDAELVEEWDSENSSLTDGPRGQHRLQPLTSRSGRIGSK